MDDLAIRLSLLCRQRHLPPIAMPDHFALVHTGLAWFGDEDESGRQRGEHIWRATASGRYFHWIEDVRAEMVSGAEIGFEVAAASEGRKRSDEPAVKRLIGAENRVAMHNRSEHSPNPESNRVLYTFFEHVLEP